MKNQPFAFPLLGLIIGILISEYGFQLPLKTTILVVVFFSLIFGLIFMFKRNAALLLLPVFIMIGWGLSLSKNQWHPISEELLKGEGIIVAETMDIYRSSEKYRKYKVKLLSKDSVPIRDAYALLYLKKENPELYVKEQITIHSKILKNRLALNPYQFDYSKFLSRKGIHYHLFAENVVTRQNPKFSIFYYFSKLKREIYNKLLENGYSKAAADLFGAMILGDRTEMDADIEDNYRKTGIVHILSISGLHVVFVYGMFLYILYPLVYLKNGRYIRVIVSLMLLWGFAVFVGFAPPVTRSALMISIFQCSFLFRRKSNIYHSLALSAFILLLINPNNLFDVGFLLSFSAVFSIVYLNPVFFKPFRPKSRLSKWLLGLSITSVSAQMGTVPFSVLFFNQTSLLFLFGNIVMIPVSGLLIGGGAISVIIVLLNWDIPFWTQIVNGFITGCNAYISWLASFDFLVFETLSFDVIEVMILLTGMLLLRPLLFKFKPQFVMVFLGLVLLFEIQRIYWNFQLQQKDEVVIFHQNRNSVIGLRSGQEMKVFLAELSDSSNILDYTIRPYAMHEKIKEIEILDLEESFLAPPFEKTQNLLKYGNQKIIILSNPVLRPLPEVDYVLVRNNAITDSMQVMGGTKIIFDGSSYPRGNFSDFWNTREDGALIISSQ